MSERATLATQQATEVKQQLAVLHAEIQTLIPIQANQPLSANTPNNPLPSIQNQTTMQPNPQIQQASETLHNPTPPSKPIDNKSPLSEGLQTSS